MKNGNFLIAFSVHGRGGSPSGPDPENRVGDQETGSPGMPFSCKWPVSRGTVMQEQDKPGNPPAVFSFKMSIKCTSRNE